MVVDSQHQMIVARTMEFSVEVEEAILLYLKTWMFVVIYSPVSPCLGSFEIRKMTRRDALLEECH